MLNMSKPNTVTEAYSLHRHAKIAGKHHDKITTLHERRCAADVGHVGAQSITHKILEHKAFLSTFVLYS